MGNSLIGLTYKPEEVADNGTIVLRSGNIQDGKIVLNDVVKVSKNINSNLLLKNGDILICSRNGSANLVGKSAIIDNFLENVSFGAFMMVYRSPLNFFIKHFLQSGNFRKQLTRSATTTINQITKQTLDNILLPLPPLDIQKQIARELDTVSELLKLRKQQLEELDQLTKSVFYEMFGDPVRNEKGWEWKRISDICMINPKKSELGKIEDETLVSFVPMNSVSESGDIDTSQTKEYKEVQTGFTYFRENDVLFAKITPCMENGKGAIARNLFNSIGFGSTEFHVLRPIENVSDSEWLYRLTILPVFRINAENNMTGSAGQKRVPVSFFEMFRVGLPPISLQQRYASIVTQIESQKALVKKAIDETQLLFDSLMSKYFDD